jgi:thymidylate synthase (FAD)
MSYAQESTRYVRYDKTSDGIGLMEFIRPVWMHKNVLGHYRYVHNHEELVGTKDPNENWINTMLNAERYYCLQIEAGWSPEKAREVLPNSLKTEIVVKANIREVRHIFQLRYRKKAHPQIRALMRPLMAELKQRVPVVFDDLYPEGERA